MSERTIYTQIHSERISPPYFPIYLLIFSPVSIPYLHTTLLTLTGALDQSNIRRLSHG